MDIKLCLLVLIAALGVVTVHSHSQQVFRGGYLDDYEDYDYRPRSRSGYGGYDEYMPRGSRQPPMRRLGRYRGIFDKIFKKCVTHPCHSSRGLLGQL